MTKVLIIDDHPMMRSALALAVRRAQPESMVLEAGTFDEAVKILDAEEIALVLLDLRIPGGERFSALRQIASRPDHPEIVVVSAYEEASVIQTSLRHGASAFLKKSLPFEEIAEGISRALRGAPLDISQLQDNPDFGAEHGLTPAQILVLECLREGKPNKQIAFELGVVEATVKAHLTAIFRKLQVSNRTQAVLVFFDDDPSQF